jgi:hypothetical protein
MTHLRPLSAEVIGRLTADTEPWLSCDDCFAYIDVVIDAVVASSSPLSDEFRVHLRHCPACREEASSLAALVATDLGLSSVDAVARLDSAVDGPNAA